jgi:uncharacterized cupredoxin-like copper-binding protein
VDGKIFRPRGKNPPAFDTHKGQATGLPEDPANAGFSVDLPRRPVVGSVRGASLRVVRSAAFPSGRRILQPAVILATGLLAATLTACSSEPATSSSAPTSGSAAATTAAAPSSASSAPAAPEAPSAVLQATEVDFDIELPQQEFEAGSYTFEVTNKGASPHNFVVEDAAGMEVAASEVIAPGQSGTVEVTLQPGKYVFYCAVDGHRYMGMETQVTVV